MAVFERRDNVALDVKLPHPDAVEFPGDISDLTSLDPLLEWAATQPQGKTVTIFAPDLDTDEGMTAMAQAVVEGKVRDMPTVLRYKLAWLMEALDAKVVFRGTSEGTAPVVDITISAVSESSPFHCTPSDASRARPALLL
ncbi:MAG: hypothetical protein IH943_04950 [Acidobacteria bacterium]|nr:hypothetical protein [Acidobacteriota bacterium]